MVAKPSFRAGLSTRDSHSPRRLLRRGRTAIVLLATAMGFLTYAGTSLASTTPVFFDANGNVATGFEALLGNTLGHDNIASGSRALLNNTSGDSNVASGTNALTLNTSGSNNVATGLDALLHNTNGVDNVATGAAALESNT